MLFLSYIIFTWGKINEVGENIVGYVFFHHPWLIFSWWRRAIFFWGRRAIFFWWRRAIFFWWRRATLVEEDHIMLMEEGHILLMEEGHIPPWNSALPQKDVHIPHGRKREMNDVLQDDAGEE